ncbi:MAG: succinate dehydrogenase iron-sulfur subunit [Chloroflexi bacterium]|nr:succinate dehydrogenase iron-sulfur subunit [Chloroflexota bacterium]MCL5074812.1 succinate dehydrogenase iron-sulfur subunit [Chloroflexota bacterium]
MVTSPTVVLKVYRYDPERDSEPRYDTFKVPVRERMTVLDALFYILDRLDSSLAFRYSCRGAVCGSCAMYINGSYRLACGTQIAALRSPQINVDPLPNLAPLRDLVVDMDPFFAKYELIRPYLINTIAASEGERLQSPRDRKAIDEMIDCILCGSCYSSCPVAWMDKDFVGPAAFVKTYRFIADSRDEGGSERLKIIDRGDGIWRCHTVFNCAEACPKSINPTYSIQQLKRCGVLRRLGLWPRFIKR